MIDKNIEELALKWLKNHTRGNTEGIEILPQNTSSGLVVWFYDSETWEDKDYFLTVPMVNDLLEGKSPRKVTNKYFD